MIYYMVPKAMDQKPLHRKHKYDNFCIAGELLTEKELARYDNFNRLTKVLNRVQVKKNKVYFCYGARFADMQDIHLLQNPVPMCCGYNVAYDACY